MAESSSPRCSRSGSHASGRVTVQLHRKSGFRISSPVERKRYVPGAASVMPRESGGRTYVVPSVSSNVMPAELTSRMTPWNCFCSIGSPEFFTYVKPTRILFPIAREAKSGSTKDLLSNYSVQTKTCEPRRSA